MLKYAAIQKFERNLQRWIKLIKSDSKDIYNITKKYYIAVF